MSTLFDQIQNSAEYTKLKNEIVSHLQKKLTSLDAPRPSAPELKEEYAKLVDYVGKLRGRDLFFKYLGSGAGNGPFVELADGSVKYDLITGIGVHFFGHGNLELFSAQFDALWCDVMQGNLGPNQEYLQLMHELLALVGPKSRLKHCWLTTCGATANEIALKIVRQKKAPATKIFAFKDCFAGRTTALQEITDNAAYRQGQPVYGEVYYLPFFDSKSSVAADEQGRRAANLVREEIARYPGKYAAFEFEIVQGEGGFNVAPREFLVPILEEVKKAGVLVWVDEIQTFGRTGEVFCYQRTGIEEYVDVVTVAKLLQTGAVLYTAELNPKPGLVSGTFAGSSSGLKAGHKILQVLKEKMSGPQGRIQDLERQTKSHFEKLKSSAVGKHLQDYTVFGGMIAFTLYDGSLDSTKKFLFKLWDNGVMAFYCGHGPYRVRMLPPFGVITDAQWKDVFARIETTIQECAP